MAVNTCSVFLAVIFSLFSSGFMVTGIILDLVGGKDAAVRSGL